MDRILIVDDELDLCYILGYNLQNEGFETQYACSAEEALQKLDGEHGFSLLLLDVMMEEMSGFEMARVLRERGDNTPIIFLTARNAENDVLNGFEVGGDDYVTKPFSFPTLLARVRAVLKRSPSPQDSSQSIEVGPFSVDGAKHTLSVDGQLIALTKKEFLIMKLLLENEGQHHSRQDIIEQVWESDTYVGDRSVDVHIARLRKKLGDYGDCIVNHSGFGYMFTLSHDK